PPAHTSTLSLPDALPISEHADEDGGRRGGKENIDGEPHLQRFGAVLEIVQIRHGQQRDEAGLGENDDGRRRLAEDAEPAFREEGDRKSTRLNSSHVKISY